MKKNYFIGPNKITLHWSFFEPFGTSSYTIFCHVRELIFVCIYGKGNLIVWTVFKRVSSNSCRALHRKHPFYRMKLSHEGHKQSRKRDLRKVVIEELHMSTFFFLCATEHDVSDICVKWMDFIGIFNCSRIVNSMSESRNTDQNLVLYFFFFCFFDLRIVTR